MWNVDFKKKRGRYLSTNFYPKRRSFEASDRYFRVDGYFTGKREPTCAIALIIAIGGTMGLIIRVSIMTTAPTCPPHKRGLEMENEVEEEEKKGSGGRGGNGKRRRHASCLTDR